MGREAAAIGHPSTKLATWRDHIDGMRAVAVLSVLLYHVGLHYFPGGFVGVDVFFVISGFLISKVIYKDIANRGRFDIVGFYERRIRRILPAFIVVTLASLVLGGLLFLPDTFENLSASALYAAGFMANIYFYLTANYFGPTADTQPLLHYWSLGVEEQFYIFFPLAVLLVRRFAPRALGAVILIVGIGSLALAEYYVRTQPTAAFYLAPQRAWELMAGSLLALPGFPFPRGRIVREVFSLAGLALILFAVFAYDKQTPFPGLSALAPVGGAALILWACERGPTLAGRLLSVRPVRLVGLWSYSIYMIHWPLIVFAKAYRPDADPLTTTIAISIASILLGWLSYRFVETPFRKPRELFSRPQLFAGAIASLVAVLGLGGAIYVSGGFAARLPHDVSRILAYRGYDYRALYREGTCFLRPEQSWKDLDKNECLHATHPSVLIWGDSHAADLYASLKQLFARQGYATSMATASLCAHDRPYRSRTAALQGFQRSRA